MFLLVVPDKVTICPDKNFNLEPPEQSTTGTCVQKFQKAMELVPLFPEKIGKSISSLGSSDPLVSLVGNILKDIGRDTDVLPATKILKPNEVTGSERIFPGKIAKPISSMGSRIFVVSPSKIVSAYVHEQTDDLPAKKLVDAAIWEQSERKHDVT